MEVPTDPLAQAQCLLPSHDLAADIAFFKDLGFRLHQIFPADDPVVAVLMGHGMHLRLDRTAVSAPATIFLQTDHPASIGDGRDRYTAPNGVEVRIAPRALNFDRPVTRHRFEVRQLSLQDPWVIGRAGMLYRDLVPDRLGGGIIASHIRIPNGGPVPDMVHYHTIGFQLIYCYKGWVRLVYEDQGPPFILQAGDCVIQPPEIRHRVLESSGQLEVIEIGVPAEHITTIDHEMQLPTPVARPDRNFKGTRFCHHRHADASWVPFRIPGFECQETGIKAACGGIAAVQIARLMPTVQEAVSMVHDCDILFNFVLRGTFTLVADGQMAYRLQEGDAFVIPPGLTHHYLECAADLELLEVALPGTFNSRFAAVDWQK